MTEADAMAPKRAFGQVPQHPLWLWRALDFLKIVLTPNNKKWKGKFPNPQCCKPSEPRRGLEHISKRKSHVL